MHALDPASFLQPVQESDQCWVFDSELLRQLSLRHWLRGAGKVQQGAPARLAESEWLEPLIEFQAPCAGGAVQERRETVWITFFQRRKSLGS